MKQVQLYDDQLDFIENRNQGPFGDYVDGVVLKNKGKPKYSFFGVPVHSPFGIGAGPLPSTSFVQAALDKGFDIVTVKSVRTAEHPLNPFPQVRPVVVDGDLKPGQPVTIDNRYREKIAVANSFGIPSLDPTEWQQVIRDSIALAGNGQVVVAAFQGTARGEGREAFVDDHVKGIGLIRETGAQIIEVNLSCPNEGEATLACYDVDITTQIVKAIRTNYPDSTFFIKLAYFQDKKLLLDLVRNTAPYVDGYSAINTMGVPVLTKDGKEAFPGRPTAGVSGAPIKWAGLEMCDDLHSLRESMGADYKIIALGGVCNKDDFDEYRAVGADAVLSVAAAMWNPYLAQEIKKDL